MIIEGLTRLEIIDLTPCKACKGKKLVQIDVNPTPVECPMCNGAGIVGRLPIPIDQAREVELSLQDYNRTLKIFVK